jgi:protein-glucosylgalactosylhydroxylysine glucosidase
LREDHISGDIAYAVWQEWLLRQNKTWLSDVAFPMLQGIADFWVSRSVYSEGTLKTAHINGVIPPDEYVDMVDDSVYTNFIAAQSLRFFAQAADVLNITFDSKYRQLADDLVILYDPVLNIHPEYAGYDGSEIKQADVVLLHYPLGMEMPADLQRSNLDYYSDRTDANGPAMTWGMHSIGYLDLDDVNLAARYFNQSFQDNLQLPLQVWTESPGGGAVNFITGAGGFLQTIINGYAGLRVSENGLYFKTPKCPEYAESFRIKGISFLDTSVDLFFSCEVDIDHTNKATGVTLEMKRKSSNKIGIFRGGKLVHTLKFSEKFELALSTYGEDKGRLSREYVDFEIKKTIIS